MANGGALYSITTRASGSTLTAAIYNADHQNHVNNGDATQLGGYSVSLAQMQSTTDPGVTGSEVLAAAISDELLRLRYVVGLVGGGSQWYNPLELTNKTGVALAVGDVVTPDSANASAVKLDDTASSLSQFVVSLDAPTNNSKGRFRSGGMVQKVNVSNATTIGHYLTKSATTKQAQDSGIASGAAVVPPIGSFAVALSSTAGAGTVAAVLLGATTAGASAATQAEMETATSNTVAATPGRVQYHPGVAKAWANFEITGALNGSYNVTSITDNGLGNWSVNLTTAFSATANLTLVASVMTTAARFVNTDLLSTSVYKVLSFDTAGVAADPTGTARATTVAYGKQ